MKKSSGHVSLLPIPIVIPSITNEDLLNAIKKGTLNGSLIPVLLGSVTESIGVDKLQNFIDSCMPSPLERGSFLAVDESGNEVECEPDPNAPFSGYVFSTIIDPYAGRLSLNFSFFPKIITKSPNESCINDVRNLNDFCQE